MGFWDSASSYDIKKSYKWYLVLGSEAVLGGEANRDNGDLKSLIEDAAASHLVKSVDKPSFKMDVKQAKYLYAHSFNFPGRVTWNPIKITFYDGWADTIVDADTFNKFNKDRATLQEINIGGVAYYSRGQKVPPWNEYHFSSQAFFHLLFRWCGYNYPNEYDIPDQLARFREFNWKWGFGKFLGGSAVNLVGREVEGARYADYSQNNISLFEVDSKGIAREQWKIYNPIISAINSSRLDYSTDEISTVTIDLAYDWAEHFILPEINPVIKKQKEDEYKALLAKEKAEAAGKKPPGVKFEGVGEVAKEVPLKANAEYDFEAALKRGREDASRSVSAAITEAGAQAGKKSAPLPVPNLESLGFKQAVNYPVNFSGLESAESKAFYQDFANGDFQDVTVTPNANGTVTVTGTRGQNLDPRSVTIPASDAATLRRNVAEERGYYIDENGRRINKKGEPLSVIPADIPKEYDGLSAEELLVLYSYDPSKRSKALQVILAARENPGNPEEALGFWKTVAFKKELELYDQLTLSDAGKARRESRAAYADMTKLSAELEQIPDIPENAERRAAILEKFKDASRRNAESNAAFESLGGDEALIRVKPSVDVVDERELGILGKRSLTAYTRTTTANEAAGEVSLQTGGTTRVTDIGDEAAAKGFSALKYAIQSSETAIGGVSVVNNDDGSVTYSIVQNGVTTQFTAARGSEDLSNYFTGLGVARNQQITADKANKPPQIFESTLTIVTDSSAGTRRTRDVTVKVTNPQDAVDFANAVRGLQGSSMMQIEIPEENKAPPGYTTVVIKPSLGYKDVPVYKRNDAGKIVDKDGKVVDTSKSGWEASAVVEKTIPQEIKSDPALTRTFVLKSDLVPQLEELNFTNFSGLQTVLISPVKVGDTVYGAGTRPQIIASDAVQGIFAAIPEDVDGTGRTVPSYASYQFLDKAQQEAILRGEVVSADGTIYSVLPFVKTDTDKAPDSLQSELLRTGTVLQAALATDPRRVSLTGTGVSINGVTYEVSSDTYAKLKPIIEEEVLSYVDEGLRETFKRDRTTPFLSADSLSPTSRAAFDALPQLVRESLLAGNVASYVESGNRSVSRDFNYIPNQGVDPTLTPDLAFIRSLSSTSLQSALDLQLLLNSAVQTTEDKDDKGASTGTYTVIKSDGNGSFISVTVDAQEGKIISEALNYRLGELAKASAPAQAAADAVTGAAPDAPAPVPKVFVRRVDRDPVTGAVTAVMVPYNPGDEIEFEGRTVRAEEAAEISMKKELKTVRVRDSLGNFAEYEPDATVSVAGVRMTAAEASVFTDRTSVTQTNGQTARVVALRGIQAFLEKNPQLGDTLSKVFEAKDEDELYDIRSDLRVDQRLASRNYSTTRQLYEDIPYLRDGKRPVLSERQVETLTELEREAGVYTAKLQLVDLARILLINTKPGEELVIGGLRLTRSIEGADPFAEQEEEEQRALGEDVRLDLQDVLRTTLGQTRYDEYTEKTELGRIIADDAQRCLYDALQIYQTAQKEITRLIEKLPEYEGEARAALESEIKNLQELASQTYSRNIQKCAEKQIKAYSLR